MTDTGRANSTGQYITVLEVTDMYGGSPPSSVLRHLSPTGLRFIGLSRTSLANARMHGHPDLSGE